MTIILSIFVLSFLQPSVTAFQDAAKTTNPPSPVSIESVGLIGLRTQDPGPFLSWPLPRVELTAITRLPDTPWTHNFLGISDCPPYPALIDAGYWPHSYSGNYAGNRHLILPGVNDAQVKWQNFDNTAPGFGNAIACYGATSSLPDHAGTDISANNWTNVLAAAPADQVIVEADGADDYRIILRHPDVNGSGQTWYTVYVHLYSSEYSLGTHNINIPAGRHIGNVGRGHLHFQVAVSATYNNSYARNPWGVDQTPWNGCLWLDQGLCPIADPPAPDNSDDPSPGHFPDVDWDNPAFPHIETMYHIDAVSGYSDGTFRPDEDTSRAAAAKILILGLGRRPSNCTTPPFSDVAVDYPFCPYIRDMKELGISTGYSDGTYRPDESLNRCGAAIFMVRALGRDPHYSDGYEPFSDVPVSHPCYQHTRDLYELGIVNGYSDGTYRPDDPISRAGMVMIAVRGLPGLKDKMPTFYDVLPDHLFYSHIEAIAERGITQGCSHDFPLFCPDVDITRGQVAAFISRAIGDIPEYTDGRQSYPDVPPGYTFYHNIEHLTELGIVQGYSDGYFRPDEPVTRSQIAIMVVRGLGHLGVTCPSEHTASFSDVPPGHPDYAYIQCLKDLNISSGYSDGTYRPDESISRGGSAKFMDRGFIQIVPDISQESEEGGNDLPGTAPGIEPVDDQDETGDIPRLIIPGDDRDWVQIDVEAGQAYEIEIRESGLNLDTRIEGYANLNDARNGENPIRPIEILQGQSINDSSAFVWRAEESGTHYFKFANDNRFATEGVNFTFGIKRIEIDITKVYLPVIRRNVGNTTPPPTKILNGTVTDNGTPASGVQLLLRYHDGSNWSTYTATTTDSEGHYQFSNLPTLSGLQRYYVRWENGSGDPNHLVLWACNYITASTTDPSAYQCNFDLANIDLAVIGHIICSK